MGQIRTRRWDDPVESGDGLRLLVCRYRPRGLAKKDETWDQWLPHLGPSKELHAAYYGKNGSSGITWDVYKAAYLKEMHNQREAIRALAEKVLSQGTITLLCSSACVRESRCHRSLLQTLIEREIVRLAAAPSTG